MLWWRGARQSRTSEQRSNRGAECGIAAGACNRAQGDGEDEGGLVRDEAPCFATEYVYKLILNIVKIIDEYRGINTTHMVYAYGQNRFY